MQKVGPMRSVLVLYNIIYQLIQRFSLAMIATASVRLGKIARHVEEDLAVTFGHLKSSFTGFGESVLPFQLARLCV